MHSALLHFSTFRAGVNTFYVACSRVKNILKAMESFRGVSFFSCSNSEALDEPRAEVMERRYVRPRFIATKYLEIHTASCARCGGRPMV